VRSVFSRIVIRPVFGILMNGDMEAKF